MNAEEFRAQLEEEIQWRIDEIRFFQNQCAMLENTQDQEKFRRALILLLYSNFEGFCKFALTLYVSAVNSVGIECKDASSGVAAASLHDVFMMLRDGTRKAKEFNNELPDDTKLHRFARDREFIERAYVLMNRVVSIPDDAIDMESNLKPIVLRKNLYRLGLPHDQFVAYEPEISRLLGLRNNIAHGATRSGIEARLYEQLRDSALNVMTGVMTGVTQAIREGWFMSTSFKARSAVIPP